MTDPQAIAARFTEVWNEPNLAVRRATIQQIWTDEAVEYTTSSEYRGYDALEERVTATHKKFVAEGGNTFHLAENSTAHHHDALAFTIDMRPKEGGEITWSGQIFLLLDGNGRAHHDYQFTIGS